MTKQLLVESIRLDGGTQSRARINDETVAEYAESMKAAPGTLPAAPWPAVVVFFDGTEYWLADGFHRLLAAQRVGRKHVAADVKQGSREAAAWAACAANQVHGLRRSPADKRRAVEIAVKVRPENSIELIADHCGVGIDLVREVKRQVVGNRPPGRVVGRDGKSYPPPKRRTKATAGQGLGPGGEAEATEGQGPGSRAEPTAGHGPGSRAELTAGQGPPPRPEERRGPAAAPRRREARPADEVDDVGRRIPEHLIELWGRRQEVQDMLTALSKVRVALRDAQDNKDPLFSEIPFSSALAHLDQAYDAVQVAKPYAVCAFCQGHGCKACGNRGLLGKFRWDTSVPKEHKEAVARSVEQQRDGRAA